MGFEMEIGTLSRAADCADDALVQLNKTGMDAALDALGRKLPGSDSKSVCSSVGNGLETYRKDLCKRIDQHSQALRQAAENYRQGDEDVAACFQY